MKQIYPEIGAEPETGVVFGKEWWICGACRELMVVTGNEIPDKCPYCGMKVKKGADE